MAFLGFTAPTPQASGWNSGSSAPSLERGIRLTYVAARQPRVSHVVLHAKRGRKKKETVDDDDLPVGDSQVGPVDMQKLAADLRGDEVEDEFVKEMRTRGRDDAMRRPVGEAGESTLPQKVADRMLKRMLWLCGVPMSLGITFFIASFVLSYKFDIRFIPIYVAYATLGSFFTGLFGLTYGIMSSSWDPEIEGSFWGFDEAKRNVLLVKDGLLNQKTKEQEDNKWS